MVNFRLNIAYLVMIEDNIPKTGVSLDDRFSCNKTVSSQLKICQTSVLFIISDACFNFSYEDSHLGGLRFYNLLMRFTFQILGVKKVHFCVFLL